MLWGIVFFFGRIVYFFIIFLRILGSVRLGLYILKGLFYILELGEIL